MRDYKNTIRDYGKISKVNHAGVVFFSASVNFRALFDEYFVAKSHSRVLELLVEYKDNSKTGFESKIRQH